MYQTQMQDNMILFLYTYTDIKKHVLNTFILWSKI